jgi:hypothetical protein
MSKIVLSLIISALVLIPAYGKVDNYHLHFDQQKIKKLPKSIQVGKPILPFKMVKILLPPMVERVDLKVMREKISDLSDYKLEIKKSEKISNSYVLERESVSNFLKELEESQSFYPKAYTYQTLQKFHGYSVLYVKVWPVYIATDGQTKIATDMKVIVNYKSIQENKSFVDSYHEIGHLGNIEEIKDLVDHAGEEILTFYKKIKEFQANVKNSEGYDYLIVTNERLKNYRGEYDLLTLKDFLERDKELKVKIVTVEDSIKEVPGRDDAEKLRNFLREEYLNHGIKYVLLAGDSDRRREVIPVRMLYAEVNGYYGGRWELLKQSIASDFYYSCLDGDFNSDGDSKWGEINDDVDFLCELTVGRIGADSSSELEMMIKKTLEGHQLTMQKENKRVLMVGELLFNELDLWGADYLDKLIGTVDDHDFISKGYDSSWKIEKLYDKNKGWNGRTVVKLINEGNFLIVNHLGHSNYNYNLKLNSYFFKGFSNLNPYFYYSQGCFAGDFTRDDSIIEKMQFKRGGFFAAVANSVYGLGPEDPDYDSSDTPGTSQILHRFFTTRLLETEQLSFARAHQKSKEDILIYIDHQEARWVNYAATYFGDPSIMISN